MLECPNPKDPQDHEVAKMLLESPERFFQVAQDWAVRFAGAPRRELDSSKYQKNDSAPGEVTENVVEYAPFVPPSLGPCADAVPVTVGTIGTSSIAS